MSAIPAKRHGLTMIELLVVLGILGFLLGLLIPAVRQVRGAAGRTQSFNNLKQLALACHGTNDVFKKMPPSVGPFAGGSQGTIFFYLLPYVEQDNVYRRAEGSVWKNDTYKTVLPLLLNPSDKSAPANNLFQGWLATSSYAANWMVFKLGEASLGRSFPDGTSNTILFAERYQVCNNQPCAWAYSSLYTWAPVFAYYSTGKFQNAPAAEQCDPALAQAADPAGIQIALGDASARIVSDRISPQTWRYACDPADGNPLGADWND